MLSSTPIDEALIALAAGATLIVVDSEREKEGDFLIAAEMVTPQALHFMMREGRGQLCVPVLPEVAERLELKLMVHDADELSPRFTIPVDHVDCHTGVSPGERCHTIRSLIDSASRPQDFVRPGHVFPLIAQPGGVLSRPGHTEAAVDLAKMAGLAPAGVLCEICSRDGYGMAGSEELSELAAAHGMLIVTIGELISYRKSQPDRRTSPAASLTA